MKRQCGRYRQGNPEIGQIAVLNCCRKVCPQFKVTIKPSDTAGTQMNFVLVSLSESAWQVCVHTRTAEPVRPVYINVKKIFLNKLTKISHSLVGGTVVLTDQTYLKCIPQSLCTHPRTLT